MPSRYQCPDLESILKQVKLLCNQTRIEDFLRDAKRIDPEIKLSGKKDRVVFEHLREAAQDPELAKSVVEMLVDAEESSQKYILLFEPRTPEIRDRLSDPETVATSLFGPDWLTEQGFPKVLAKPQGHVWGDFRIGPTGTLGSSWVVKRYLGKMRWESEGRKEIRPGLQVQTWVHRLGRSVFVARWRPEGFLEMRVPQRQSRKALFEEVDDFWSALAGDLLESNFKPIDLTPACMRLINDHHTYTDTCRLGDARVVDDQEGSARISPRSGREHLMGNNTREQAVKLYQRCRELVVTWFMNREAHDTQEDLRTVVGKHGDHTIHIRARTTGRAVQHVTDQFLRLLRESAAGSHGPEDAGRVGDG